MSNRIARRFWNTVQWKCFAFPVLALLAVFVAVLYRRAFAVGVLSDGWVLLEIGSRGFRKAPFVLLSYHTRRIGGSPSDTTSSPPPYFEQQAGVSLLSKLHAGQSLKVPLAAAADPIWVGLKFLHTFTRA